jgi:glycosyltransferase involved in cell wall biosynthesis
MTTETIAVTAESQKPLGPHRNDDVCVIVPMYNESLVIADTIRDLSTAFDRIVCVDDGSQDDTALLASRAGATVVHHPVNLGQGAALQTGVDYALGSGARFFLTFDADGQHRIEDAVAMVERLREGDLDIVLGSRFLGTELQVPRLRKAILWAAVLFTRMTTGLALTDTHNGLRVMNRSTAVLFKIRLSGMAHASEILDVVARHNLSYEEMPISVVYSEYSLAKGQSSLNAINVLIDIVLARLRVKR